MSLLMVSIYWTMFVIVVKIYGVKCRLKGRVMFIYYFLRYIMFKRG